MKEYYVKVKNNCLNCRYLNEITIPTCNGFDVKRRCSVQNKDLSNMQLIENCEYFEFDKNILRPSHTKDIMVKEV